MSELLVVVLFAVSILITVSSLDDAFIDLLAAGIARYRLRILAERPDDPLPKIAVFVANWHEEDMLGKMVEGNLARIQIPEVSFFLGVYPNDSGTLRVAKELEAKHPDRVRVIVNTLPGPTSKGQMLNEMFSQVFSRQDCPDMAVLGYRDGGGRCDRRLYESRSRGSRRGRSSHGRSLFALAGGVQSSCHHPRLDTSFPTDPTLSWQSPA